MLTEDLMREVRRLRVRTRRRVDSLFAGEYHSAFKGQGIEFAEVREYAPGDDVRAIDWNVTARSDRTFVKQFIEERQLTVLFAFDSSASGAFGTQSKTKARLIAEAGAAVTVAASSNRDRVGLLRFSDEIELYVAPGAGPRHTARLMRELLEHAPAGRGLAIADAIDARPGAARAGVLPAQHLRLARAVPDPVRPGAAVLLPAAPAADQRFRGAVLQVPLRSGPLEGRHDAAVTGGLRTGALDRLRGVGGCGAGAVLAVPLVRGGEAAEQGGLVELSLGSPFSACACAAWVAAGQD